MDKSMFKLRTFRTQNSSMIQDIVSHSNIVARLCPFNAPLDLLDAHFLTGLLIVVVPLTFREVDTSERS